MIDIRKLKELVRLMVANDLTELDLRDTEEQVTIQRPSVHSAPEVMQVPTSAPTPATTAAPLAAPASASSPPAAVDPSAGLESICSPMVGTFYSAASPDAPAFVKVGDVVNEDTVVCLVEAMKIFNEIKAECAGTIEKVLVNNGDPVEFGQELYFIKPS